MKNLETIIIDTRNVERIEGAAYHSDDHGSGVHTAWSAGGEPVARFTFGNGNVSAAMCAAAAGVEVYRDGYGYMGAGELVPAFEAAGATYYREA